MCIRDRTQPIPIIEEFQHKNWKFSFTKSTISPSGILNDLQSQYFLQKIPDSVFGQNNVKIQHLPSNLNYCLNIDSMLRLMNFKEIEKSLMEKELDSAKYKFSDVQIYVAQEWKQKKLDQKEVDGEKVKILDKISDVFFSSAYRGD
eukprot:TRINITY_DN25845_c0_g1_i1.p1 TRINITY_DN25845_c0_g1~~TRINITY_DN25845_c0_g1_i1.p1  ORF type:complete len:146 (+),score=26.84 TRINITY_DN25845_c0_g1_i1:146-583(+)